MLVGGTTGGGLAGQHNSKYYLYSRTSGQWDEGRVRNAILQPHMARRGFPL